MATPSNPQQFEQLSSQELLQRLTAALDEKLHQAELELQNNASHVQHIPTLKF